MSKPKEITKEKFLEKYGNFQVKFQSYHKYVFTYNAVCPGDRNFMVIETGGDPDDIYAHDVEPESYQTVRSLDPRRGVVYRSGELVEHFREQ